VIQETVDKVAADESSPAGNEDAFAEKGHCLCQLPLILYFLFCSEQKILAHNKR
jgi:hypothetical protein